jgi:hypothetical protein
LQSFPAYSPGATFIAISADLGELVEAL